MIKNRLIYLCLLIIIILSFRIWTVQEHNEKVSNGYINGTYLYKFIPSINTNNPYMLKQDLQKADLVGNYIPGRGYLALNMPRWIDETFTLKNTLIYYTKPSIFSKKAMTIKKGSICYDNYKIDIRNETSYEINGFRSWPTYRKGWRIVVPFPTESTIDQHRKNEVKTPYYVRTEDLYQAFTDYIGENTKKSYGIFYEKDLLLYRRGYFASEDFYKSVWTYPNVIMITAIVVMSLVLIAQIIKGLRCTKKVEAETEI